MKFIEIKGTKLVEAKIALKEPIANNSEDIKDQNLTLVKVGNK